MNASFAGGVEEEDGWIARLINPVPASRMTAARSAPTYPWLFEAIVVISSSVNE